ncbi:hypothetical protein [Leifsonia sp. WHRI 6310E]|uniref:hypothetical protein n=1 Tax=Leifsonia sp. WHRI 6310E TaxID=3162562 RepID=UPI0032EC6289
MTDRDEFRADDDDEDLTRAEALAEAVSGLGQTPEDQLNAVAEHNDSLEERLPESGSPEQG